MVNEKLKQTVIMNIPVLNFKNIINTFLLNLEINKNWKITLLRNLINLQ
jgi:hypothetical protein